MDIYLFLKGKLVTFCSYLYLGLSERTSSELPPELTSQFLVKAAYPTHCHTSSLPRACAIVDSLLSVLYDS